MKGLGRFCKEQTCEPSSGSHVCSKLSKAFDKIFDKSRITTNSCKQTFEWLVQIANTVSNYKRVTKFFTFKSGT